MGQQKNITEADFSSYLFWGIDRSKLSLEERKGCVIDRVLTHEKLWYE